MRVLPIGAGLALAAVAVAPARAAAPVAQVWLTTGDEAHKLDRQPDIRPSRGKAEAAVRIDPARHFQQMHGYGAALTDASAELIARLPPARRRALLTELFGRGDGQLGFDMTRLTVGASDFSRTHYSFDDSPGNTPDPQLRYFSIAPARRYVIPVTREVRRINPDLKVMISPWSAPAWMKTTKSLIKGHLEPSAYPAFARYLARTVEAYGRAGVRVDLLSIQNEPDFEPENYPGMKVTAAERAAIIGGHVGPLFARRGIHAAILDWDHNWDKPEQPLAVLADPVARRYVGGIAWHCYAGDVAAQGKVHDAFPDKPTWFTECAGGNWSPKFGETLGWMVDNLVIGAANNWARGTIIWNLALDPQHGPHDGGCGDCRGVVTIDPTSGAITRNVEYYALGHASRFVRRGAWRVGATARDGIVAAAFVNPDGSRVAILHRAKGEGPVRIAVDGRSYDVPLPAGGVATLRWPRR